MRTVLLLLLGLLLGGLINLLADSLPAFRRPRLPRHPDSGRPYPPGQWLALARRLQGLPASRRALLVEGGMALWLALLPLWLGDPLTLAAGALYSAILILIIVIDLEHRLILHLVTFPSTALALLASFVLPGMSWRLAVAGAASGFLLFFLFYWAGRLVFGPGALGFGDVTLSMTLGAMLGFQRIFFALVLGVLLGGISSLLLLLGRRRDRRSTIPYGPYLAVAGMAMLVWGTQLFAWYTGQGN